MRDLIAFARMARWPLIFAGLMLLTHDGPAVAVVVLALVFRSDLSAALRRRRVTVEGMGFRGCVETGTAEAVPERPPG